MFQLSDDYYPKVRDHICESIEPLTISVGYYDNVPAVESINKGLLVGWCWQSTTFMSVFFADSTWISRGYLTLPEGRGDNYFHSWIELIYNGEEYVFDPALDDLRKKEDYYREFNVRIKQQIQVAKIKSALIDLIRKRQGQTIYTPVTNNIEDPFFRATSNFTAEMENDKIRKLNAEFYSFG